MYGVVMHKINGGDGESTVLAWWLEMAEVSAGMSIG